MNPRDRVQSPEPAPGDDVGGYVLKALLGQGGFGTVYLAERGGQRYALKLLPLAGLGDWGERELLMLARVKHPNVVRLLGYWQWPDHGPRFLVIIMEYVEGRRLDAWADTENPSAHAVLLRLRGVTRALKALHEGKALHRDVKEANILVREADGEAVLVDLGVGSHEDLSRITGGSLPPGTRAYLSPEAWRFHREHQGKSDAHYRSTRADDLYALGVVLYWLLTGRRPFHLEEQGDEAVVVDRVPVAPHVRNGRVPEALGSLCLRLLETRPELRPDADALLAKLEELLARDAAEWHVPLCDFHDAYNVTTRPGPDADEEAGWFNEARKDLRPRRGRRPPRLDAELERVMGSSGPTELPLPLIGASTATHASFAGTAEKRFPVEVVAPASNAPGLWRTSWTAGVLSLLVMLCIAVAFHGGPRPSALSEKAGDAGHDRKVAPPEQQPESNEAAVPPEAVSTPAAIALPAMPHMEPAPVMKPTPAGTSPRPHFPPKARGTSGKALKVVATTCTLLGCSGASELLRPPPPLEPCPPGAIETMKSLDIDVGDTEVWTFGGGKGNRILTVHEGWTAVFLPGSDFGDIPNGSMLSGRLFISDRVYGRITQVRLEGTNRTVPVCMEMLDTSGDHRGLELEPGSSPTAAKVWSYGYLKAVSSFE